MRNFPINCILLPILKIFEIFFLKRCNLFLLFTLRHFMLYVHVTNAVLFASLCYLLGMGAMSMPMNTPTVPGGILLLYQTRMLTIEMLHTYMLTQFQITVVLRSNKTIFNRCIYSFRFPIRHIIKYFVKPRFDCVCCFMARLILTL